MQQGEIKYEIIIGDDNSPENYSEIQKTKNIIISYNDKRIKYYKNKNNLGSAKNIQKLAFIAKNDILFFLCQDDIISKDALIKTYNAFLMDKDIGAVTRPYFWFDHDIHKPVRVITPYNADRDSILSIWDGKTQFLKIFESLGQLSGLAFKRELIDQPFGDECFTGHIYPFARILRKYKCVILKDYTIAVSILDSQSRHISFIYDLSPTYSWIKMYQTVFKEKKYKMVRDWGIEHITTNFIGLVQIKNYSSYSNLIREIFFLLKYNWKNIFQLKYWIYSAICLFIPRFILKRMVDKYKHDILSRIIQKKLRINFNL